MSDWARSGPASADRLARVEGERIERSTVVSFKFEGRQVSGYAGDTIASALFAAGVRTFSRSFKYHRPRGLLCIRGHCPNCLVQVGDTPNVRACTTPISHDISVRRQNAWPSADRDLLRVIEKFSPLLPVGFYYKTFIHPRFMWPHYERVIRKLGGLGTLSLKANQPRYEHRRLQADVAVVGGGLGGMSAACAAASAGADVILIDDQPVLGGRALARVGLAPGPAGVPTDARQAAAQWRTAVDAERRIMVLGNAAAFGLYEDNLIAVLRKDVMIEVRAREIVAATGTIEQPLLFSNNDLPGIFLSDGVRRLLHLYRVRPGAQVMVAGADDRVAEVALELRAAGVSIAAAVDSRSPVAGAVWDAMREAGGTVYHARAVREALGQRRVEGAVIVPTSGSDHREHRVRCDTIVMVGAQAPDDWLVGQGGRRLSSPAKRDDDGLHIHLAGRVAGWTQPSDTVASGREAGRRSAARATGAASPAPVGRPDAPPALIPVAPNGPRTYICLCEDVTCHDLEHAIGEGFGDLETLKRYATAMMGPCQGRMCTHATRLVLARETGVAAEDVGTVTARPPAVPVPLAAFAGPRYMVEARSPLARLHAQLDARPMRTGDWIRPEHYGNPLKEVQAVRTGLGLIDVSTLGRLEVSGADAVAFLERVYTGRFAKLGVGRLRYGILCTEEGAIRDEGVVCRLASDRFVLTTSTSGAVGTLRWCTWCRALWKADVFITDLTAGYGAVNLAGPPSRDVLQPLVDIDLSPSALPMLGVAEARVAGIPCLVMRVGFVGELSYEIHFPSDYGEYLWTTLMSAGAAHGIQPFGVEAQKVLRLEKGHLIVGQDTDGLTDPFSAGLDWTVKLDKPAFIGKQSLAAIKQAGPRQRLVAFILEGASAPLAEGSQVVEAGRSVGRVTSCRFSPTLSKVIGLASVPDHSAQPGGTMRIRTAGGAVAGQITAELYDPQGQRQTQ